MTNVKYILNDGTQTELEAKQGSTVMETAVYSNVPGIEAECGGSCSCATCHVYVDEKDLPFLPEMDEMEDEMLDEAAAERRPNSRLSCQLVLPETIESVTVTVPERQV